MSEPAQFLEDVAHGLAVAFDIPVEEARKYLVQGDDGSWYIVVHGLAGVVELPTRVVNSVVMDVLDKERRRP